MIKAIIFDCFGVLVGSGTWEIYERAGGDLQKDGAFIDVLVQKMSAGKLPPGDFTRQLADRIGIPLDEYKQIVNDNEQPNMPLFDFIAQELKPHYKIALLSNVGVGVIERKIPEDLRMLFDAEVLSAEVGMVKPDAEIFNLTAERLGVKPNECVFTDDREKYLAGAKATGMQTILFKDYSSFRSELEKILTGDTGD